VQNARRLAEEIVCRRAEKPVETVENFLAVVQPFLQPSREKKDLAKVFQALRIEVNHELDALQEMLNAAERLLRPGGRLVVLTYHSVEDRMVKNFMRAGNVEGRIVSDFFGNRLASLRPLGKAVTPPAEEQAANPRSRSAKLRIAEKIKEK
ncbi:MAG: 16S rRNA (cytosine(1402)-N(4))-methyltransferase, partial [Alloprevotella sp.]|nr:16S rRNA (cytosine(1402)-N(4))-methyltransferase [Alloprevotella sp.]